MLSAVGGGSGGVVTAVVAGDELPRMKLRLTVAAAALLGPRWDWAPLLEPLPLLLLLDRFLEPLNRNEGAECFLRMMEDTREATPEFGEQTEEEEEEEEPEELE